MGGGSSSNKGKACSVWSSDWGCTYKIFETPSNDEERKINALLNFAPFVGAKTSSNINQAFSGHYAAQFVLLFPPALQNVYVLNSNITYDNTSRVLSPKEYTIIPNPLYDQARALQNIMFGATSFPCSQTYLVPFSLAIVKDITGYDTTGMIYETITNPGYGQCTASMYQALEIPQIIAGQRQCTNGIDVYTQSPSLVYSKEHIDDMFQSSDESLFECIEVNGYGTNNVAMVGQVLLVQSKVGPYDTTTGLSCKNLTDVTCTYEICSQSSTKNSVNCTIGGCQNVTPGTGAFDSIVDCEECQNTGNCYSNYTCCAQQQNYGMCTSPPTPKPPSSSMKYIIIGIAIIAMMAMVLVLLIRYRNSILDKMSNII